MSETAYGKAVAEEAEATSLVQPVGEVIAAEVGQDFVEPARPRRDGARRGHALLAPHRVVLTGAAALVVIAAAVFLRWDWLPNYAGQIVAGVGETVLLLVVTTALGFLIAVPVGLVQVVGRGPVRWLARGFCTIVRGTPLLLQLWLLYYGLGSLFPSIPGIRQSWMWPYLRQAWPYAVVSLTVSFVAYEGEVMRGAFAGVPRGQLEAARACGMSSFTLLRRVWLPLAVYRALPTLAGETVLQLKSTPLVAT
ncbi:MAG: ABC transporter permease subunit, partial [Parafilimonas terrae]|nr:ABC transporter permease subunit [Parafilimonas terrae]